MPIQNVSSAAKVFLASCLAVCALAAPAPAAAPAISVRVTGVPPEVEYGQVLRGVVEITLSGLDAPAPLVIVTLDVLEGEASVSHNAVALENRGNGVHKLPLSGTPVMALSSKPQARLLVQCSLYSTVLTDNRTIDAVTDVSFAVKGAPGHTLYEIVKPVLTLTLEKTGSQGKPSREIGAALSYSVKVGAAANKSERLTVHERLDVTGPVNKIVSSQTKSFLPEGEISEVKGVHAPLVVTEPGVYTYHYRIDPEWGAPITGTASIEVPAEEAAKPAERALLIDSATVTPTGPVGGKFIVKLTYHASDLPFEGATVQEWVHFEGPADDTLMVERTVEGTGQRTSIFEATFANPGIYTWRISVSAPGLKPAAKELTSEVTPATSSVPAVPVYVSKGPVIMVDDREGRPLPAGLTVGELSLTYRVDWPPGQKNVAIMTWNPPPLSLQEGQTVTLTLNSTVDPTPQVAASWFIDCDNGSNRRGLGLVSTADRDPKTSTHSFAFKPYMGNYRTFIALEAGRFGNDSATVAIFWRYERQDGAAVLTTIKDVTPK